MFMRRMRDSAKWVMLVLSLAFVGWLVFDWVQSRGGNLGSEVNPVVGEVEGRDIRYADWNVYLQNRLAVARQQRRGLTEEDVRRVEEQAWEDLVNTTLLEAELDRLGVTVTDDEVRLAFLNQPPPEMFDHPAFQTDGQFDIEKYRRFMSDPSTDEASLLQLESYYRNIIPRAKLQSLVEEGIYVSEAEAWRFYRDVNETARVRFVRVDPRTEVPDSAVTVTDEQVRAYYAENADDFQRPASARVNMVSISIRPTAADTAAARERAAELRRRVAEGEDFAEVARAESADSISAALGGDIGRRARDALDPVLAEAAFSLRIGAISEPVETGFGYHILRVDERSADTVSLRQIYIPVEPSGATEDSVFDLIDELEDLALRTDLVTAADSLGVPIQTDVFLAEGVDFVPGAGPLGVAPEWALEDPETVVGDLSPFFENATGFHVFELLGRQEAGRIPLQDVELSIRQTVMEEEKKRAARTLALRVVDAVRGGASLEEAAARFGWSVTDAGPFGRGDFVPGLGQGTEAVGEAFGLKPGQTSGVVDAGDAVAIVQLVEKVEASRDAFEEAKASVRAQLAFQRRQSYVQRWLAALRENAEVRDLRDQLVTS